MRTRMVFLSTLYMIRNIYFVLSLGNGTNKLEVIMSRRKDLADDVKHRQNPENISKNKTFNDEDMEINKEKLRRSEKETEHDNEDIEKETE